MISREEMIIKYDIKPNKIFSITNNRKFIVDNVIDYTKNVSDWFQISGRILNEDEEFITYMSCDIDSFVKQYLNQQPTLDKDIEEVLHRLKTFKDSQVIYGGEWGELQDAIDVIQAQQSKLNAIEEIVKEMEIGKRNTFIPKHIYVNKIKQILKEETNEKDN